MSNPDSEGIISWPWWKKILIIILKGYKMLFFEHGNFIKPENLKYTSYIKDFNIEKNGKSSFFLSTNDWDFFCDYMAKKRPDTLMVLEYKISGKTGDGNVL